MGTKSEDPTRSAGAAGSETSLLCGYDTSENSPYSALLQDARRDFVDESFDNLASISLSAAEAFYRGSDTLGVHHAKEARLTLIAALQTIREKQVTGPAVAAPLSNGGAS